MKRRPIILIMTSHEDQSGVAARLADAIRAKGTHNVVIIGDDKYGSVKKLSLLDRLMDTGQEYQYLLESKDRGVIRDKMKRRKFSKRVTRIGNMLRRFNPEYVLCVTPYAHHCAVEAKKKLHSRVRILYLVMSFTAPKRGLDEATDTYIVENADVKAALIKSGVHPKDIMIMGLPFDIPRWDPSELVFAKQDLGLPVGKTVFVSVNDKKKLEETFSLLLDQGNIATYIIKCENAKLRQSLGMLATNFPDVNIVFVATREKVDDFLRASDVAILSYDVPTIYKCLELGVPPLVISNDEHIEADISFLLSHGLIVRAKEEIDIVGLLYKLLQTELGRQISQNGRKWTEFSSVDNIANFLITYIGV